MIGCSAGEDRASTATAPGLSGIRYLADDSDDDGFERALSPRPFEFPRDHGSHPGFRTEWWYFTGNVADPRDRHFGFELTIFRIALASETRERESTLATNAIWMANLAVTDTARREFHAAERLSRGAPGLAYAGGDPLEIRVEDWFVRFDNETIAIRGSEDGFGIDLLLTGLERIVAQGDRGLDPKGPEPGNASYYYSAPRLDVTGTIEAGGSSPLAVDGTAWMDREWSTSALSPDLSGWDWFALQLDDGRDLMFYRLRGNDGSTSPFSGGSVIDAAGNVRRLDADAVELDVRREWQSPVTDVRYPVEWRMRVPGEGLDLDIEPRIDRQELDLAVRYWEGAIRVSGDADGEPIEGVGYLELAGY